MSSRWFFGPHSEASSSSDEDDKVHPLPSAMSDSWRTWVMTGARKGPTDHRRVRGAHRGLKKMLVEGLNGGEHKHPWQDFSSAMIRQSVDHAVNSLPDEQKQAVKLAYFGGLSNREIASRLGIPVGGVRRCLRQALAAVSDYVERGQMAGRACSPGTATIALPAFPRSCAQWRRCRLSGPTISTPIAAGRAATGRG